MSTPEEPNQLVAQPKKGIINKIIEFPKTYVIPRRVLHASSAVIGAASSTTFLHAVFWSGLNLATSLSLITMFGVLSYVMGEGLGWKKDLQASLRKACVLPIALFAFYVCLINW